MNTLKTSLPHLAQQYSHALRSRWQWQEGRLLASVLWWQVLQGFCAMGGMKRPVLFSHYLSLSEFLELNSPVLLYTFRQLHCVKTSQQVSTVAYWFLLWNLQTYPRPTQDFLHYQYLQGLSPRLCLFFQVLSQSRCVGRGENHCRAHDAVFMIKSGSSITQFLWFLGPSYVRRHFCFRRLYSPVGSREWTTRQNYKINIPSF